LFGCSVPNKHHSTKDSEPFSFFQEAILSKFRINLSIERLSMYENMDTNIIDTSEIGTEEIVQRIKEIIS
ncbi:hypothetical protein SAMN02744102_04532, partial [Paenibacillus barengoltzii]